MRPTLLLVALAVSAALLVSGCTQQTPAPATPAPPAASPAVSSSEAQELESLLNATVPELPELNIDDLSL